MEALMDDAYSKVPAGTEWCPECNGYGSSLMEETDRCTRCGGSGLILVADRGDERPNGQGRARTSRKD
jgi:DnaJ-class molecular chaperone